MDFALGHVNHFDVLVPETEELEDVLQALLQCLDSQRQGASDLLLSLGEKDGVELSQLLA